MKIELFIVQNKGKWFAYTREILEAEGLTSVEGSAKQSEAYPTLLEETFSREGGPSLTGCWCSLTTKEQWLDGDNQKVEARITDKAAPFVRHGDRWDGVVVEVGTEEWNLHLVRPEWTKTEAGLGQMPLKMSQLIKAAVISDLYGGSDDPLFPTPSSTL